METKASYVVVGAFVLAGLVGLLVSLIWVTGSSYREEFDRYTTYFSGPVTGLGAGTAVRYNGIDVGRVSTLDFDPNDPKRVIVTLEVKSGLALRQDSVASIESQGLTGGSYVEIEGGTANAPPLTRKDGERYPVIPSRPSSLQQIFQSGPELMSNLNQLTGRGSDLLNDENRKVFAEILVNMRDVSAALSDRTGEIDAAITNIASAAKRLDETMQSATDAARMVSTVGTDTDALIRDSRVQLADSTTQLTQLLAETRAMIGNLSRLTGAVDREPTLLLFGDRREGYTPK